MRPALPVLLALSLAAGAAGCGNKAADLFVVARSGSIAGADLRMRVIDDGRVVCNGATHDLDSHDLIAARRLVEDLQDPAKARTSLPPGHPTILRFAIRTADGTVAFSDTSAHQPAVFFRAAQLVRTIARGPCGLPR